MNINDISRQIERVTKNEDAGSWMQVLSPITVEPIPGARILLRGMHAPEVQQFIIDSKLRENPRYRIHPRCRGTRHDCGRGDRRRRGSGYARKHR